jgi:hypothetical protein
MSVLIEFVLPDPTAVAGLQAERRSWGGESVTADPPRYRYDELCFTLVPIAQHVRLALPASLNLERCLELEESVVLAWSRGELPSAIEGALQRFIEATSRAAPHWAAVCDASRAHIASTRVDPARVFSELAVAVTGSGSHAPGLAIFVVSV